MTVFGWIEILLVLGAVVALTRPLGEYLYLVLEGETPPLARVLGPIERLVYRLCGVETQPEEQTWLEYTAALLGFNLVGCAVLYALLRLQHLLPLNTLTNGPDGKPPLVSAHLAFNTAVSFTTNTNWQSYAGETTLGYLAQMLGLTVHNFVSAATGVGVALAFARGLTRRESATIGNFWRDLVRTTLYVLLPISFVLALALVATGVPENLQAYDQATTLEGNTQVIAQGPVASQEAIKELGTNGGGFFNANSSHPFENPSPLSNVLEILAILSIPAALTYTFGRMAKDTRQGWTLLGAFLALLFAGIVVCSWAEGSFHGGLGNLEGKETRFGIAGSALFACATTGTSCGAVNSMHESFTPLGGMVPLVNIMLGEVVFGGVGAGLYAALVYAILSVFIAGLMVGRTPEYLGKKIEAHEVQLATLYVLIFPAIILVPAAIAALDPPSLVAKSPHMLESLGQKGPHGLSEILYCYTSGAGNNGSAFAGLNTNTDMWDCSSGLVMLFGRFAMIVPCLAIAGSLARKKVVPPSAGTFPTYGGLFALLFMGVIVIVGALTFFPALSLGPVLEHLQNPDVVYFRGAR
jgi:K+-transporting ATPase ATPase A chain